MPAALRILQSDARLHALGFATCGQIARCNYGLITHAKMADGKSRPVWHHEHIEFGQAGISRPVRVEATHSDIFTVPSNYDRALLTAERKM
ncbi:hypothetical protein V8E36_004166 [Tilletia maclaganii]